MALPILAIVAAVAAAAKIVGGVIQNSKANKIKPKYTPYQPSQQVKNQYDVAQQMFQGRMPGAVQEEQNIMTNQANTVANAERSATDSGQLLSIGSLAQGASNEAYQQLGLVEAQDKYRRFDLLESAKDDLTKEGDKVYADMMQKYQMDTQQKAALRSAAWQNIFGGISDLGSAIGGMKGGGSSMGGGAPTQAMSYGSTPTSHP